MPVFCLNPEAKTLAASICQCITQCMPMAFGTLVFIENLNPDPHPNSKGESSLHKLCIQCLAHKICNNK